MSTEVLSLSLTSGARSGLRFQPTIPPDFELQGGTIRVAGSHHRRNACIRFSRGTNLTIQFQPEPENKFDPNAIAIIGQFGEASKTYRTKLGYVPKNLAAELTRSQIHCIPRLRLIQIEPRWIGIEFDILLARQPSTRSLLPGESGIPLRRSPDSIRTAAPVVRPSLRRTTRCTSSASGWGTQNGPHGSIT